MTETQKETIRKNDLASQYHQKLQKQRENVRRSLNKAQCDFFNSARDSSDQSVYTALEAAMKKPGTVPSEYIASGLNWLFRGAVPARFRDMILYFADRLAEYPYSASWFRRSFRTKDQASLTPRLFDLLRYHCVLCTDIVDAPLEQILTRELPEDTQAYLDQNSWREGGYTEWQVAYALDRSDGPAEEAIRRILTEENGAGLLTRQLIRGVLKSHRTDFHELLGKLLLAARLQEGLRQTICENADCGTKAGFLTLLKVIDENRLIRFSSVKRAVGTWIGIVSYETHDLERVSDKSVRLIADCLESKAYREECLASEDAMRIYIALWSYGFDEVGLALQKITGFAESGSEHQILVTGYFASNLDLPQTSHQMAKTVLRKHSDQDKILAVWLPNLMSTAVSDISFILRSQFPVEGISWFDSKEEADFFYRLFWDRYAAFSGKTKTYSPCIFPWYGVTLARANLAELLCAMAFYAKDREKSEEACTLLPECTPLHRPTFFRALLQKPSSPQLRKVLLDGLADKEGDTRKAAYDILSEMTLSADEYRSLEDNLRFKRADIRKNVSALLLKQNNAALSPCITRLLQNENEDVRLAGMDMLLQIKDTPARKKLAASFEPLLTERAAAADLSEREKLLLDTLLPERSAKAEEIPLYMPADRYLPDSFDPKYTNLCADTFAAYFPKSELPDLIRGENTGKTLLGALKSLLPRTGSNAAAEAEQDLLSLSDLIDAHKTDEYVSASGESVLLGNANSSFQFLDKDGEFLFSDLWKEWRKANAISDRRLVRAAVLLGAYPEASVYTTACEPMINTVFGPGFAHGRTYPYTPLMCAIVSHLLEEVPQEARTQLASVIALWFVRCVPDKNVLLSSPNPWTGIRQVDTQAHLLAHSQLYLLYGWLDCRNTASLQYTFPLAVASAEKCLRPLRETVAKHPDTDTARSYLWNLRNRSLCAPNEKLRYSSTRLIREKEYLTAAYQGILTEAQLFEYLLQPENISEALRTVTAVASFCYEKGKQVSSRNPYKAMLTSRRILDFLGKTTPTEEDEKLIRFVVHIYEILIPVILADELRRGDSPATYSAGICSIARIYGAENLANLLAALGNDTLDRTAFQYWMSKTDRKTTLSYLLSVCIPAEEDTAETLKKALSGKKITKKRLIEAALFSPDWIPLIGQYLQIDGFESVCYYFMAHMNEKFDDKRRAIIAKYTPLEEEELNLGAFDVNWFRAARASVGDKEFDLIYDAAKYITEGSKHARARKYADASLGKFTVEKTEKTIAEKRNKDLLMAYALIPLQNEDDTVRRYLYLQKYRKESRQFGSQRAASEAKAAETALTNLAINAGYSDTVRLTLRMETKVMDDNRALLQEQIVDGVSLHIVQDETGKASLQVKKDGKSLKNVPSKLKNNETVAAMTAMAKTLTEQYRRTRRMLENAMEDRTEFTFGEISALYTHPVVYPMLKNLVLLSGDAVGFPAVGGIADDSGTLHPLEDSAPVRVAHPFDLYQKGCWRNYQKYLFDRQITQSFRQVFRELYIKTEEELQLFHSLRYAGNQIQPAKTVATLKGRRWIADVENGLQKVYYKENIVAEIYAMADWFSPADIEAPTLEWVCFSDRKTGAALRIADIPDILFSEVMRDVDLAVSVAHAGGVDPETSHSTMEMRAAILSFVLPMFRIQNVRVEGRHALVQGKFAEYSVHLGSGVVHQVGGAMIPVLPVHSEHRGKIFLPFVDDDPKTAEIISKVLLFAEDTKIKDPMILSCIQK